MTELSPIDRLLRTDNVLEYDGNLQADARRAGRMFETFNKVNETIAHPDQAGPSMSEVLRESFEINKEILTEALKLNPAKGLAVDTYA